jgi:DNA-binding NtrC family response regulator
MVILVQATVLTVGLNGRNEALKELPIRLITMQSGSEAARSLKNEKVDSIVSKWDLDDMKNGRFLRKLKAVKPEIPTIVLIDAGNLAQEISARSLGVSAVLTNEIDDDLFRETVANVLGIKGVVSIKEISLHQNQRSRQETEKITN